MVRVCLFETKTYPEVICVHLVSTNMVVSALRVKRSVRWVRSWTVAVSDTTTRSVLLVMRCARRRRDVLLAVR